MSIIDSYDPDREGIIAPARIARGGDAYPEITVATFQEKTFGLLLKQPGAEEPEKIDTLHAGREIPVYKIAYRKRDIAVYHTILGGAGSAGLLEEVLSKGTKKVLFFGSCGVLDKNMAAGRFIVPSRAYRDEGASYHYLPPSDYVEIPTANALARAFEEISIPCVQAPVWTTDGFYRETRRNMLARKREGCVAVEMECASVMAVGQFRGASIYQFLYAADSLDGEAWDPRILGSLPDGERETHARLALELASRL